MRNVYVKDIDLVYSPKGVSLDIKLTEEGQTAQWTDAEGLGHLISEALIERAEGVTVTRKYDPDFGGLVETVDLTKAEDFFNNN